jgi:hypothetical protein
MDLTLRIPDDMATRLAGQGGDLERRALEGFALAEYQAGRLTRFELRQLLGIETRFELDDFLKTRGAYEPVSPEDIRRDLEELRAFRT